MIESVALSGTFRGEVKEHEPQANLFGGVVSPFGASLSAGFTALVVRLIVWAKRRKRKGGAVQDQNQDSKQLNDL